MAVQVKRRRGLPQAIVEEANLLKKGVAHALSLVGIFGVKFDAEKAMASILFFTVEFAPPVTVGVALVAKVYECQLYRLAQFHDWDQFVVEANKVYDILIERSVSVNAAQSYFMSTVQSIYELFASPIKTEAKALELAPKLSDMAYALSNAANIFIDADRKDFATLANAMRLFDDEDELVAQALRLSIISQPRLSKYCASYKIGCVMIGLA